MENLNWLVHALLYALLAFSGTTVLFLAVLFVARARNKDYTAPKKIATWAGIASSVGSFAIAALNVSLPIGILPETDPAYEAIKTYYTAIQGKPCSEAWTLIHSARIKELKDRDFGEEEFCRSYGTTLTFDHMEIQRLERKNDAMPTRIYHVAYDVWDELPRNDLYDLRLKDYADVVKARSYDESKLTGIIMHNLRLYYVVTDDAEAKVKELIANTPFWFTGSPEFIGEIKRAVLAGGRHVVGRHDRIALAGLVNLHRLAVEIRVGKMAGRAPEVDQREIELLGILVHAGAAPNDLLELAHRADLAVEHDQAAGLRIDAG